MLRYTMCIKLTLIWSCRRNFPDARKNLLSGWPFLEPGGTMWRPPASATEAAAARRRLHPALAGRPGRARRTARQGRASLLRLHTCPTSAPPRWCSSPIAGKLTPEEATQVRAYFISVDPERDTPEVLRAYAPSSTQASSASQARRRKSPRLPDVTASATCARNRATAPYAATILYLSSSAPTASSAGRLPHASPASEFVAMIRSRLPG